MRDKDEKRLSATSGMQVDGVDDDGVLDGVLKWSRWRMWLIMEVWVGCSVAVKPENRVYPKQSRQTKAQYLVRRILHLHGDLPNFVLTPYGVRNEKYFGR